MVRRKSLANDAVIARVNGELWDLERPFEGNATVQFFDFDSKDGTEVPPPSLPPFVPPSLPPSLSLSHHEYVFMQ
jgi:hypothetical protein